MSFKIPGGQKKATYVKNKFSVIANRYDLFNDIVTQWMHRYWKGFLVRKAGLKPGDSALDICCGTGDITQRLENVVGDSGKATGLDFSAGMLHVARARTANRRSRFLQGDATCLPMKSESQDAVTVGFGLRNLDDIQGCLSEVLRVLKPGGCFLSLDMGKVKIPLIRTLFQFYFFVIVPKIGKMIYPGEEFFDYFPHSSLNYPSQEKLSDILENTGFSNVRFFNFHFGSTVIHYAQKQSASTVTD
ncbi:MAG: ubiquinone/menaquinone biosynthesis methyltransferase [Deltaproteobacteria bacterium]|jgi:demethylmenaquinone methyltransferase / 2-methoxy-6-polyprenyl-1,4-benzoquinol methylase|nr:ubiquinone/menaquinone biosynthesis methyltransferase [Deltaproteobacteria bacterium]MBT4088244.1 ubiquinone/menaquinone biosynthesis methyltransferase [Deltaproteobacteria bacterium]MBT4268065.1 ubiquinone/menaquinone biosynthesis methyltransferase [Deltaproteobacteria bacterium]MBT4641467.1 ubiquinone/menaquinone biosynthesis methyltransferase [Deltaproteobacteria bacterium]MBT6500082.1 ubiquinone/menaquinone biosynthesis methyltransferase [Deltaproteobacteria bacterium]